MARRWPNSGRGIDLIDMNREWPGNENGPNAASRHAWLVFNKLDMVPEAERQKRIDGWVRRLRWKGPVFGISALAREGLQPPVRAIGD